MHDDLNDDIDVTRWEVAAALDQTSRWSLDSGQMLLHHLALRPHIRGLDLGCGTGFLPGWQALVSADARHATFHALEQRLNDLSAQEGELRVTVLLLYLEGVRAYVGR